MKVLAIDDNHDNLLTLSALFKIFMPEACLITSQSGAEGIRRAMLENPDTILLDIQMPGMDGYEATRRLKAAPSTQHIPIILVTAHHTDAACKVRGLECGADAFLSKPIDEAELVAQIKAMVRIKRSEDDLRRERDDLEALVDKRTAQLIQTNQQLTDNLARLAESEARYSRAVAGTSDGIWDWNLVTGECYYSPRWKEMLGYADDELKNHIDTFFSRIHPEDRDELQAALAAHLAGQAPCDMEFRLKNCDGGYLRCRARGHAEWDRCGNAVRMSGALTDITERQQMEEQLRQSQKMEAVGQLAGGVAHDFNNILTVIAGYANILKMDLLQEHRHFELAEQIAIATERAAQLTRGLLAFSRKQAMAPQKADLREIVQRVEKFLVRVIGEDIQLKTQLLSDPLPVCVDLGQIEQVLINLAANARDAMEQGGTFTIATGLLDIGDPVPNFCGSPGRYAVIVISDDGKGMDAETAKKVFEPFFTTKEVGKGTGLGMAIVYGIIQQHKGFINLNSRPGEGTTFTIYLPLVEGHCPSLNEELVAPAAEPGSETILVAEDDPGVRNLVDMVLSKHGYQVILAENGHEAVERFSASRDEVQLILMDIIMPGRNGIDAFAEIRKLQPEAKVLFTSGYTSDYIQSRGMQGEFELLMKPVQPVELLRKVREVLRR